MFDDSESDISPQNLHYIYILVISSPWQVGVEMVNRSDGVFGAAANKSEP
jgi:hypothetical protein